MNLHERSDAGNTDDTFYKTRMDPPDWYKWFRPANKTELGIELDDSDEWMEVVHIELSHVNELCCAKKTA